MKRVVVLSDIHGNLAALEAVVARLPALKPDQVAILGDHALFGPQPSETIDLIQQLQKKGALVTAGTGDIAVADLDYAASFPSLAGTIPLSADLDPSTTLELLGQTDSRVVCVGFTHTARVKDYGWKVLVDAGSVGMPYDGDATAAFTVIDINPEEKSISAEVYRASYDTEKVADAVNARGLTGDTYRAATLRTGKLVR